MREKEKAGYRYRKPWEVGKKEKILGISMILIALSVSTISTFSNATEAGKSLDEKVLDKWKTKTTMQDCINTLTEYWCYRTTLADTGDIISDSDLERCVGDITILEANHVQRDKISGICDDAVNRGENRGLSAAMKEIAKEFPALENEDEIWRR